MLTPIEWLLRPLAFSSAITATVSRHFFNGMSSETHGGVTVGPQALSSGMGLCHFNSFHSVIFTA